MKIKSAEFIMSNSDVRKCPKADIPEFAFIGRSNVGKSSLINMLTNRKNLAKTSGKPGKTQLINHFQINNQWYLVDLPGYGWAKVSKTERNKFGDIIARYLVERENLVCTFVLIDIRLKPQPIDLEFINWMGENNLPFALIFTKADKLSKNKVQASRAAFHKVLKNDWAELPVSFITSSLSKEGAEDVLDYVEDVMGSLE
ncbi:MAG: YihA family ribosome biogenesis GTP-binding protein [Cyclobacteriaceae bacterium]|nr:YihA family ribosome biogenesis GTP-binding protein [Cyclobacteriaceae bacterium]